MNRIKYEDISLDFTDCLQEADKSNEYVFILDADTKEMIILKGD